MSAASPSAISASGSAVAGLRVRKRFPETASRHSAPIRRRPPDASRGADIVSLGFKRSSGLLRVVVDAAADFPAEPAGFHVSHEKRGWAVLVAQGPLQVFQDAEARVQPDEVDHF